jgi:hypothetical protein
MRCLYLPDNFLIIFRKDKTTPYTSFASSSKGKPVDCGVGAVGACEAGNEGCDDASFSAKTPEPEERVLRGLL